MSAWSTPRAVVHFFSAIWHTALIAVLPFAVGLLASLVVDMAEVGETLAELVAFCCLLFVPLVAVQLAALASKVRRERRATRQSCNDGFWSIAARHARVLTANGVCLLALSVLVLLLALWIRWAQFGVMAVFGLTLVYLISTIGMATSAFYVGESTDAIFGGRGIKRHCQPAAVTVGERAKDCFVLERVPIPFGFRLLLEGKLPAVLATTSRHVVDRQRGLVSLSAEIHQTQRGVHALGPARAYYQDIFGLTRVAVAQAASASLKVLPRIRRISLSRKPHSASREEDFLSRLCRQPSEDYFRFREYQPYDDTRRIHWKLSAKTSRLQVRLPETVPVARRQIILVLDSYLPADCLANASSLQETLDQLVEGWLSLARQLCTNGERVTLRCLAGRPGGSLGAQQLHCQLGGEAIWADLGAHVGWQAERELDTLVDDQTRFAADWSSPGQQPQRDPGGAFTVVAFSACVASQLPRECPPVWVVVQPRLELSAVATADGPSLWRHFLRSCRAVGCPEGSFWRVCRNRLRTRLMRKNLERLRRRLLPRFCAHTAGLQSREVVSYHLQRRGEQLVLQRDDGLQATLDDGGHAPKVAA